MELNSGAVTQRDVVGENMTLCCLMLPVTLVNVLLSDAVYMICLFRWINFFVTFLICIYMSSVVRYLNDISG